MRQSSIAAISVAVLIAGTVSACGDGGSTTASGAEKVSVSVTHPEDLYGVPWDVGRDQGFFEDAGVVVEKIVPSEGGGTTLQNVVSGKLPFGEVATGAIVNAAKRGAPVQIIGGGIQSVVDVQWAVKPNSTVRDIKDTAGLTWGFTNPGSVSEAISQLVPRRAGIQVSAEDRTSTGGTGEGIALLEAGDVDLTYVSPRVAAENPDSVRVIVRSDDLLPEYQQTMIISSRNYAEKNPQTAKALLMGYAKSIEWIEKNPDKAGDAWAKKADMDPATARRIMNDAVKADHWGVAYNPKALAAAEEGLKFTDDFDSVDWSKLATDEYLPADQKGELPD